MLGLQHSVAALAWSSWRITTCAGLLRSTVTADQSNQAPDRVLCSVTVCCLLQLPICGLWVGLAHTGSCEETQPRCMDQDTGWDQGCRCYGGEAGSWRMGHCALQAAPEAL